MRIFYNIIKIRHKIRLIIYTLTISLLLLFHSKFTNSFELDSTDSFVNLFITPQSPPLLPSLPLLSKKKRNCSFGCILLILFIFTLTSISLTYIIHKFIYKRKLYIFKKDVEFGNYSFEEWEKEILEIEFERQQIINERRKKQISYIYIQNQLPTIYEETTYTDFT